MLAPRLIVGLGNPGAEYEATRHNVGFWLVDQFADKLKVTLAPQGKFFGWTARAGDLWLLQPTTFMNRSGQSVAALANFYKIAPDEILVVHDDLDLSPGGIRLKQGGGNGGHNGLKSIEGGLQRQDYARLRIGVGPSRGPHLTQQSPTSCWPRRARKRWRPSASCSTRCPMAQSNIAGSPTASNGRRATVQPVSRLRE